ncbi:hypothetical protein Psed_0919 [Pseudonocardia dioxanivorans CB1190]|uniref:Alpha/beta hydrolase n=1 Tax=Pseudonocardia dioxanivorans (strain ATCC 55486 / DSM 44775 / JCM 13855 / CB1190) TaxID=675635 RepID=F4CVA7_PSEUX|nr:alpha/beta hydrolase [Pseudonocardia dioxanivorans]AEA23171.1 hypothetical protein Psed_0919 [Pseudonocardia dioxanivorans CB1190]
MKPIEFTTRTSSDGVLERDFVVDDVPGVLWSAETGPTGPLVLLGHGGGTHKRAAGMSGRAHKLVLDGGLSAVTLDAPAHGDRPRSAYDEEQVEIMQRLMAAGDPVGPVVEEYNADIARRAVPEWRATLDALQRLPEIGAGPVGYFGLNMGTAIGIPLVAAEPRIAAAVFGVFWHDSVAPAAKEITVPLEFVMQWDDEHIPREQGLALFDAFGSTQKTLHANAGRHKEVPRFESDSATRFFVRHLLS